jgi:hypothetical protein
MGERGADHDLVAAEQRGHWTAALGDLARKHLPLVASVLLMTHVAVRIAVVGRFDITTVHALLTTIDPVSLALALVVDLAPALVCIAALTCLRREIVVRHKSPTFTGITLSATFLVAAVVLNYAQFVAMSVFVVVAVLAWRLDVKEKRVREHASSRIVWSTLLLSIVGVAFVATLYTETVWLPSEAIVVGDQPPFTAYVLNDSPKYLTVLVESDRRVEHLLTKDVERQFCETGWISHRSVFDVLTHRRQGRPNYGRCPRGN